MTITVSACRNTSPALSITRAPTARSGSVRSGDRFQTTSFVPAFAKFRAMAWPIPPSPMKPISSCARDLTLSAVDAIFDNPELRNAEARLRSKQLDPPAVWAWHTLLLNFQWPCSEPSSERSIFVIRDNETVLTAFLVYWRRNHCRSADECIMQCAHTFEVKFSCHTIRIH
jgi:hypothetical protein